MPKHFALPFLLLMTGITASLMAQTTSDGAPYATLTRLANANLTWMDSTWQPTLRLQKGPGPKTGACTGVSKATLTPSGIRVTGYKSNGSSPDDVTAHVFRRGAGLILDIIGVSSEERMMTVSCFSWQVTISGLRPGPYALSVRQTDDPTGPARSRLLAWFILDLTTSELWRISPVPR